MRRVLRLCGCSALIALSLAACGVTPAAHSASAQDISVTGRFDVRPVVHFPNGVPDNRFLAKTLIAGNGPDLHVGDSLVINLVAYSWSATSHRLDGSTYRRGIPMLIPPHGGPVPALQTVLHRQRTGSRILVEIPPGNGSGPSALILVIDLLGGYGGGSTAYGVTVSTAGNALPTVTSGSGNVPQVAIPPTSPPSALTVRTLIHGPGAQVRNRQFVILQGVGLIWRTRTVLASSWRRGQPFAGTIGAGGDSFHIPGLQQAVVGQTVGSRVLLIVPPDHRLGVKVAAKTGVKASDTLVFVIDILGAYGSGS